MAVVEASGDVAETGNPILYVEEHRRLPLRRRRAAVSGAVHVYRSRSGRLSAPPGGYTAGELWWRAPRVAYEIDMTRHPFELTVPVDNVRGVRASVEVVGYWQVHDPCAVVAHRVTDPIDLFWVALHRCVGAAFDDAAGLAELAAATHRALPETITLPEGLWWAEIGARVLAGTPDERLMRELLTDDDALSGGEEPDLLATWQQYSALADAGLRAISAGDTAAAEERESLVSSALQRFSELVVRLGDHLSGRYGRRD
jgi:hypothetical protein